MMKNTLVADSSFGTLPAPFCEFPSEPRVRRRGREAARGEWSVAVRFAIGLAIMAVLAVFVGLTSLLQFGAFNHRVDAPAASRTVHESPASEAPVFSTEGDSK
jgi:hypothetical protein